MGEQQWREGGLLRLLPKRDFNEGFPVRFGGGLSGSGRVRDDAELCHIPDSQHTKAETGDPQSSGRCPAVLGVKPSRLTCRPVDLRRTRQLTPQALRGNHHVPFA